MRNVTRTTHSQLVAVLEWRGRGEALPAKKRAVLTSEILERRFDAIDHNPRMPARDPRRVERHVAQSS